MNSGSSFSPDPFTAGATLHDVDRMFLHSLKRRTVTQLRSLAFELFRTDGDSWKRVAVERALKGSRL